jgi:hypothetical protein
MSRKDKSYSDGEVPKEEDNKQIQVVTQAQLTDLKLNDLLQICSVNSQKIDKILSLLEENK